jgi:two-component system response regulator HydG
VNRGGDTTAPIPPESVGPERALESVTSLVALWAAEEPWRAGELAPMEGLEEDWTLGRGDVGEGRRVRFFRQGPGLFEARGPLDGPSLSRQLARFRTTEEGLLVVRVGQRRMFVNGVECERAVLLPGDTLYFEGQLLLYCTRRVTGPLPPLVFFPRERRGLFAHADSFGILGEHPLVWAMRELIAVIAAATQHVLIRGESGTGKELAANAIHKLSVRCLKALVERNAATFPATLMDSELSGNPKDYPNVGTPERIGLYGLADGGILFLDEIGDLPIDLQAKLLRTLAVGRYERLGEGLTRTTDFRLIGAMNRPLDALKHDLLARLTLKLNVPSLAERREDIPLLARGLLLKIADENPKIAGRFVWEGPAGRREVRMHGPFVDQLVRGTYPSNVRGLYDLLCAAALAHKGNTLRAPEGLLEASRAAGDGAPGAGTSVEGVATRGGPGGELTKERVIECLERHRWLLDPAAAELGLNNRFVLQRLMKKLGIAGRRK